MKKTISIFAPFPPYSGGMSTLGLSLYNSFLKNGHRVIKQQTESGNKGLFPIPYLYLKFFKTIISSDIVHIISASGNALIIKDLPTIIISKLLKKKTILNFVGGKAIEDFEKWFSMKRLPFYLVDVVIVPTNILKNKIKNFDSSIAVKVIPHMVEIDKFIDYEVEKYRRPFVLLIAKSIEKYSGHQTLINIFLEIQKTFDDVELWIVGSGKGENKLKSKIIKNKHRNIFFFGNKPNHQMPEVMNKATLLIHGSQYESFGISLVEAMASSVPVIAFKVGGIPEVVIHKNSGLLIPYNSVDIFVEKTIGILKDDLKLKMMKKNALIQSKKFKPDKIYPAWIHLHSSLFDKKQIVKNKIKRGKNIENIYDEYLKNDKILKKWSSENRGNKIHHEERFNKVKFLIEKNSFDIKRSKILDLGCASGNFTDSLLRIGFNNKNITGVDLRRKSIENAISNFPKINFKLMDAKNLKFTDNSFDCIIVFTLFSSVLSFDDRKIIAAEAKRVLKPNGFIIHYDLRINNPFNKNIIGINKKELYRLFPEMRLNFFEITLIPPIARNLGAGTDFLYPIFSKFRFLNSHYICLVKVNN